MNIGLTGGIASGKSTVSAMMVKRGARLVDADQIAREVVLPGNPVLLQIAERFGQDVLQADGTLDRRKLGGIVFANPEERKALEAIIHPPIRKLLKERMESLEAQDPNRLVVVDVPLLFESNLQSMFSQVLLVYVPRHVQRERLMTRDGLTEQDAERRLQAQMSIEDKRQLADLVIDNSGSLEDTEQQVDDFLLRKATI